MHADIRPLKSTDAEAATQVINAAAQWYASFLPPEEWTAPEMTTAQWLAEAERMRWYGYWRTGALLGVMGLEPRLDAFLIRHAYVDPACQRGGVGSDLLTYLEAQCPASARLIAGTYAANSRAARLFARYGYRQSADPDAVLRRYYDIPAARRHTSITFEKRLPPVMAFNTA